MPASITRIDDACNVLTHPDRPVKMRQMGASIPILTFHRVDASASVISFPPQLFADGLRRLRDLGYRSFSLGQTVECLSRQEPFPDKAFVVTFDDGFESVHTEAFPVLQELGWSATVFLVAGETDQLPWFDLVRFH